LICVYASTSQRLRRAFVVLLRDTTWKCGTVERLIVNYLRRQIHNYRYAHSSVEDMLDNFDVKEKQQRRFLDAIERLEKRGIIKIVFNPFSSSDEVNVMSR
jgi:Cdc6-like AAA superfamily ATPase